jgi:sigma-B regulation protein RsbU (phosphoserine phosphatase)
MLTTAARYRLLLQMSQKVSGTLDLQAVLAHLLSALESAVGYDAAGIFVLRRSVPWADPEAGHMIAGVARVGFEEPRMDDPMLRSGQGIIGHVIATGERVVCPDVRLDPRYVEGRPATRSELAVPIASNGRVIGALNLESDRPGAYGEEDAELLEFFASAAAISIEKALLHREVLQKHQMDQQMRLARDVQASLLPAAPPVVPGHDVAAVNLPTLEISGDYYDFLPLAGGRLALVIADVSGKGVPAALIMATFRTAVRSELRRQPSLAAAVDEVGRILVESMDLSRFVTTVCGVLDPSDGTFSYVNCGHNPPLLLRGGGTSERLDVGGSALGFGPPPAQAASVSLREGDTLVLYTDGVVEPANALDEEFGVTRLESVLRSHEGATAATLVDRVVEAARRFSGRPQFDDDVTLVVVRAC